MPYYKGRAKPIWTGDLAEGVEPRSEQDDRICWHVAVTWQALDNFRAGVTALTEQYGEVDDKGEKVLWVSAIPTEAMRDLLAPCVRGWENYVDAEGNPVPFSPDEMMLVEPHHLVELYARLGERAHQIHVKKAELSPTPAPGPEDKG